MSENNTVDLDELAVKPLEVTLGGKKYAIEVSVATMMAADRAQQKKGADQWTIFETIMAQAGLNAEAFRALSIQQATKLSERITGHFFPEGVAAAATDSTGQTPSSPSSDTSEETQQS